MLEWAATDVLGAICMCLDLLESALQLHDVRLQLVLVGFPDSSLAGVLSFQFLDYLPVDLFGPISTCLQMSPLVVKRLSQFSAVEVSNRIADRSRGKYFVSCETTYSIRR